MNFQFVEITKLNGYELITRVDKIERIEKGLGSHSVYLKSGREVITTNDVRSLRDIAGRCIDWDKIPYAEVN